MMGSEIEKTLNVLRYTKESEKAYNAKHADAGYHAIKLNGEVYGGQRDCFKRFEFINPKIRKFRAIIIDQILIDPSCIKGHKLITKKTKKKKRSSTM